MIHQNLHVHCNVLNLHISKLIQLTPYLGLHIMIYNIWDMFCMKIQPIMCNLGLYISKKVLAPVANSVENVSVTVYDIFSINAEKRM